MQRGRAGGRAGGRAYHSAATLGAANGRVHALRQPFDLPPVLEGFYPSVRLLVAARGPGPSPLLVLYEVIHYRPIRAYVGLGPSYYPASLLWSPGPRPSPVFRSAVCDCLSLNVSISLSLFNNYSINPKPLSLVLADHPRPCYRPRGTPIPSRTNGSAASAPRSPRPARRARRLGTLILPLCARGARLCAQCNVSIEEMDGKITGLANTVGPSPRENERE